MAPFPTHGWQPHKTATGDPRVPVTAPELHGPQIAWVMCPNCHGQRRIYYATDEGMRWGICARCGGIGSTMRVVGL